MDCAFDVSTFELSVRDMTLAAFSVNKSLKMFFILSRAFAIHWPSGLQWNNEIFIIPLIPLWNFRFIFNPINVTIHYPNPSLQALLYQRGKVVTSLFSYDSGYFNISPQNFHYSNYFTTREKAWVKNWYFQRGSKYKKTWKVVWFSQTIKSKTLIFF